MTSERRTKSMRNRLARRDFLGSSAAIVSLPFLGSLFSRDARAQACADRQRFIAIFVPNGLHVPDFTPTTAGPGSAMPQILEPLAPIRATISVITGTDHQQTAEPRAPPGAHGSGTPAFSA